MKTLQKRCCGKEPLLNTTTAKPIPALAPCRNDNCALAISPTILVLSPWPFERPVLIAGRFCRQGINLGNCLPKEPLLAKANFNGHPGAQSQLRALQQSLVVLHAGRIFAKP